VNELFREKELELLGEIEFRDGYKNILLVEPLRADARFEDYSCRIRGDKRAMSDQTRKRMKQYPEPFPTNLDLLFETSEEVKRQFERRVDKMVKQLVT
jgi:hypothetical protein